MVWPSFLRTFSKILKVQVWNLSLLAQGPRKSFFEKKAKCQASWGDSVDSEGRQTAAITSSDHFWAEEVVPPPLKEDTK